MRKKRNLVLLGLCATAGMLFQSYTDWYPTKVVVPEVYSKPVTFTVSRINNIIKHTAEGQKMVECRVVSPLTADIKDSSGTVQTKELVRYFSKDTDLAKLSTVEQALIMDKVDAQLPEYNPNHSNVAVPDNITAAVEPKYLTIPNSSVYNVSNIPSRPRYFKANQFIIVVSTDALEKSDRFTISVDCVNPEYGKMTGEFGPFPIPKNGETLTEKSPEAALPQSLPIRSMLLQGGIILVIIVLLLL